jgi:hypothetical protein
MEEKAAKYMHSGKGFVYMILSFQMYVATISTKDMEVYTSSGKEVDDTSQSATRCQVPPRPQK